MRSTRTGMCTIAHRRPTLLIITVLVSSLGARSGQAQLGQRDGAASKTQSTAQPAFAGDTSRRVDGGRPPASVPGKPLKAPLLSTPPKRDRSGGVRDSLSPAPASAGEEKLLGEFQRLMMQVATKASNGDATARARLDAWQSIVLRYQSEIVTTTRAATAGNASAAHKLRQLQAKLMHEWMIGTSGAPVRTPVANP